MQICWSFIKFSCTHSYFLRLMRDVFRLKSWRPWSRSKLQPPRSDKSATHMLSDSAPFSLSTASLASFLSIVHNASDLIAYFFTVSLVLAPHPTWKWLLKMTSCGLNWTKTNLHQHAWAIYQLAGQMYWQ